MISTFDSALETTINFADSLNIGTLSHPIVEAGENKAIIHDWWQEAQDAKDVATKALDLDRWRNSP